MSIVVSPGRFHGEPHPAGKLATTLLAVTVAGMADPIRFRRGKLYVADGAVTRLDISPGTLRASVTGSRADPYDVIATVALIPRPEIGNAESLRPLLSRLTPEGGELMTSCTCPDWDDPCKHAVAALLAFADELVSRPELLLEWRCEPIDGVQQRRVGSRATRPSERHLRLAPAPPDSGDDGSTAGDTARSTALAPAAAVSPYATPEWATFLAAPAPLGLPPIPTEPAAVGNVVWGPIDLSRWIDDAISVFRDA